MKRGHLPDDQLGSTGVNPVELVHLDIRLDRLEEKQELCTLGVVPGGIYVWQPHRSAVRQNVKEAQLSLVDTYGQSPTSHQFPGGTELRNHARRTIRCIAISEVEEKELAQHSAV